MDVRISAERRGATWVCARTGTPPAGKREEEDLTRGRREREKVERANELRKMKEGRWWYLSVVRGGEERRRKK